LKHFQSLKGGQIRQSKWKIKIRKQSLEMIRGLFRESLPRFSTIFRSKIIDIYIRYCFHDESYPLNDLWKYVTKPRFWLQLKEFHDNIYSRSTMFKEMVEYIELHLS
jgi:hypothetical protein